MLGQERCAKTSETPHEWTTGNKQRVKGSAQWVVGPDSVQWSSEQQALGRIQMGQGKAHVEGQGRLLSLT